MDRQAEIRDLDSSLSAMTDLLLSATDTDSDLDGDFAEAGSVPAAGLRRADLARAQVDPEPGIAPASEGILGGKDDDGSAGAGHEADAVGQVEQVQAAVAAALGEVEDHLGPTGGGDFAGATPGDAGPDGPTPSDAGPGSTLPDAIPTGEIDALMAAVSAELDELDAQADAAEGSSDAAADAEPLVTGSGAASGSIEAAEPAGGERGTEAPAEPAGNMGETTMATATADTAPAGAVGKPTLAPGAGPPPGAERKDAREPGAGTADPPAGSATRSVSGHSVVSPAASKANAGPGLRARVLAVASPLAARVSAILADILTRGLEPLAVMLAGQPKLMRHSLAWLALWTAFNAGCVWGFLVFFRSTGGPADASLVTQIAGSDAAPGAGDGPAAGPVGD